MRYQLRSIGIIDFCLRGLLATTLALVALHTIGDFIPGRFVPANEPKTNARLGKLPLAFEANQGQAPEVFQFVARQPGFALGLSHNSVALALNTNSQPVNLRFAGANSTPQLSAQESLPSQSNYLIGDDPQSWQTNVPQFARVRYDELYPGVDLVFYGSGQYGKSGQLEYDFVVAPHADPRPIKLVFEQSDALQLDESGALLIQQGEKQLRQHAPVTYQLTPAGRREIQARYAISATNEISFVIGDYDAALPLVIDPVLSYSTYLGGANNDVANSITTDANGNIYVAGQTTSLNFPLRLPYEDQLGGGSDAFVSKLNPSGTQLIFSTYLGGRGSTDRAWSIAVDKATNVYVTGETNSLNFPTTSNAAQSVARGNGDAFVTKLNIQGNVLLYSTYLGGNQPDVAYALALDKADSAYVTGRTDSANFPLLSAVQTNLRGTRDAFVTKLNADGAFQFSTYLGGTAESDQDTGYGIALDALNRVFVTGLTNADDFPTLNAFQPQFGGVEDAFLSKLDLSTNKLLFSTYLGGDRADGGRSVAVDGFGNPCVTGYALSLNFPRLNALQNTYGGSSDAFVTKFKANGNGLIYSTFLGGSGPENSASLVESIAAGTIAVDALGFAYLTGKTESENFPVTRALQETKRGDSDAFLTKLAPAGNALIYSTYFGTSYTGSSGLDERGVGLALDAQGTVFLSGQMLGTDMALMNPFQNKSNGGASEAFIAKISTPDIVTLAPVSAASYNGAALAPESIVSLFGVNLANATEAARTVPLPTTLQGVTVRVKDAATVERVAPLFFVAPGQVNLMIPADTASGAATITLSNGNNPPIIAQVLIQPSAPALFTANATGEGIAAATVLRVKADGSQTYEAVAEFDPLTQRFIPLPIDLGPASDQVYLLLFGSGLRNRTALSAVAMRATDVTLSPAYVGAQGVLVGLDQINVLLPRALTGRGLVNIETTVDGQIANIVSVTLR